MRYINNHNYFSSLIGWRISYHAEIMQYSSSQQTVVIDVMAGGDYCQVTLGNDPKKEYIMLQKTYDY
jgi:hypothetical protein